MKLGSTLQRAAPTDKCTSSRNVLDSIDQWRPLFERSELGVAMINSGFHFLVANPAFLTMFGYSSEELQQLSFLDICIDEARDDCRVPLRELREGVRLQYEIETQHRRKDGTSLPVNTYFSAVSERGPNQRTFLTVTVDISARRAAEDALRAAQSELGRVARLTTVGAMAATIAHELNQPLAAIVSNGNAGLRWLDRPEPNLEEAHLAFECVVSEGHRAAHIITGIRAMFRKDSGDRSPVAVNELVCDVVSTSLGELKSRRVSLALELLDDLSPVQADRVQLQQVLLNLFTNAVELHGLRRRSSSRAPRPFRASGGLGDYQCRRFRHGDRSRAGRTHVRSVFHDQTKRHWVGFVYLSLDSRGARRSVVGVSGPSARLSISSHVTCRPLNQYFTSC